MAAAGKREEQYAKTTASERRAFIFQTVASVVVEETQIRITLRPSRLRKYLLDDGSPVDVTVPDQYRKEGADDRLILYTPARLKLCSGTMRLVIPPGQAKEVQPRPNATLIKALVRAYGWKTRLLSGEVSSIRAIANEEGVSEQYVACLLPLAFLAPDIMGIILDGYQPVELELKRLLQNIPIAWEDQRRSLAI